MWNYLSSLTFGTTVPIEILKVVATGTIWTAYFSVLGRTILGHGWYKVAVVIGIGCIWLVAAYFICYRFCQMIYQHYHQPPPRTTQHEQQITPVIVQYQQRSEDHLLRIMERNDDHLLRIMERITEGLLRIVQRIIMHQQRRRRRRRRRSMMQRRRQDEMMHYQRRLRLFPTSRLLLSVAVVFSLQLHPPPVSCTQHPDFIYFWLCIYICE
ncbi:uncharacterized protein LOC127261811 [Andrographis paniculata]|uniref:uncharacterized protein LOC127261811 n=1 Tax=Andrographis paniculata TaxID=175694 RepID=UPI0021E7B308|nr:uncharacterized protein LOC127261811 [Andrographis paniculata]